MPVPRARGRDLTHATPGPGPTHAVGPGIVVVVAGGDAPSAAALKGLPPDALVVAADSGVDHAHALGLTVTVAVGDFDSASAGAADRVLAAGGKVERYPVAKDATDLELALDAALTLGARQVVVLGGEGGRFDHWLANVFLLASPRYAGVAMQTRWTGATVTVVRPGTPVTLRGTPGDLVTLLPVHGIASGVRTERLRYPLRSEALPPGTSRGVSNEFLAETARVTVSGGVLLAIQPT